MSTIRTLALLGLAIAAGGAALAADAPGDVSAILKESFRAHGQATLDRLDQDKDQLQCSRLPSEGPLPDATIQAIQQANLTRIRYPADGKLSGDWREGEKIAQSGVGKQFNDDPKVPAGGNCYACHQLAPQELSFGTLGPSLYRYGKLRGASPAMQQYTYGKIHNSQAFRACSIMPRFGHQSILTESQIQDVVALLLDPSSPVNQ